MNDNINYMLTEHEMKRLLVDFTYHPAVDVKMSLLLHLNTSEHREGRRGVMIGNMSLLERETLHIGALLPRSDVKQQQPYISVSVPV